MERRTGFSAFLPELSSRRVGLLSGAGGTYVLGVGSQRWRLRLSFRRLVRSDWGLGQSVANRCSAPRLGFSPPYEISYRGVKLPMVSAAFGRFQLRREADLPQVAPPSGAFPPVIRPGGTARAG